MGIKCCIEMVCAVCRAEELLHLLRCHTGGIAEGVVGLSSNEERYEQLLCLLSVPHGNVRRTLPKGSECVSQGYARLTHDGGRKGARY